MYNDGSLMDTQAVVKIRPEIVITESIGIHRNDTKYSTAYV